MVFAALSTSNAQPIPADISPVYQQREADAPASVRQDLQNLRDQARQKGWTFKVGATSAFTTPISELASTRLPNNFEALAAAQNELARKAIGIADESALLAGKSRSKYLLTCKPTLGSYNWRDNGRITAIRNQGSCGSCWSFAAAAAFEGSYAIRNGSPIDLSEQHILNCSGAGDCEKGGFYNRAFQWMLKNGTPAESQERYTAADGVCNVALRGRYRAVAWGYVTSSSGVPLNRQIKEEICANGPLAAAMNVTPAFQAYVSGVFNEKDPGPVNHAVTIVGWDDSKGAWLVKNSWDENWGESGYVWMSYGSNKIGTAAAWVRPTDVQVPLQVAALKNAVAAADSNLKQIDGLSAQSGFSTMVADPHSAKAPEERRAVWIHFSNKNQKAGVEKARIALRNLGYLAPEPEYRGAASPNDFQVRYFKDADAPAAESVAATLNKAGLGNAKAVLIRKELEEPPIEVWFPKQG